MTGPPSNAATEVLATAPATFADMDAASFREAVTDDFVLVDQRRLVALPLTDAEGYVAAMMALFEMGRGAPSLRFDFLDVRGDRLVLARVHFDFDDETTISELGVYQFDDEIVRLERASLFDPEDEADARSELDRLAASVR